jgi:hypothetical protein
MNTVRKILQSDDTATVTVEVPVSSPRRQFEVVVVWQEVEEGPSEWPEGWLEATDGTIDDPTFVRPPQGELEHREHLE